MAYCNRKFNVLRSRLIISCATIKSSGRTALFAFISGCLLAVVTGGSSPAHAQTQTGTTRLGSVTGLALPRFASLKASRINVRRGPGRDYPIAWVFRRVGLPVEIIGEADIWRRIRDSQGAEGWIHTRLLSHRRTALVIPWEKNASDGTSSVTAILRRSRSRNSAAVARLGPGMLVDVHNCDRTSCAVSLQDFRGWVAQAKLWGIYPDESFN